MLPLFEELVAVQKKDADISLTGVPKTELIQADIDKTEYTLFEKKSLADLQALGVHQRKTRTMGNEEDDEARDVEDDAEEEGDDEDDEDGNEERKEEEDE